MLHIIISSDIKERISKRKKLLLSEEPIALDDITADFSSLENYAFPSLFSLSKPVIHGKYLIEIYGDQIRKELLGILVNSPTLFVLEERFVATPTLKILEKSGAIVTKDKPIKPESKQANIFNVTNAITSSSKKDRWLSYRKALEEHSVESIMGVLYWKLKSLIETSPKKKVFQDIYTAFMQAHKQSWQKGFPLELAIEKAILEQ